MILTMRLQAFGMLDGDALYIRKGSLIDEDEAYQTLYEL